MTAPEQAAVNDIAHSINDGELCLSGEDMEQKAQVLMVARRAYRAGASNRGNTAADPEICIAAAFMGHGDFFERILASVMEDDESANSVIRAFEQGREDG